MTTADTSSMSPPVRRARRLTIWVRGGLLAIACGLIAVFAVAAWLDPNQGDQVWLAETHTQLGLPSCSFKKLTGVVCPSCGMTTSFALLIRGDLINSARANFVGTGLATTCLAFIAWAAVSVVRGRTLFFRSLERPATVGVVILLVGMLLRWGAILGLEWWTGTPWW